MEDNILNLLAELAKAQNKAIDQLVTELTQIKARLAEVETLSRENERVVNHLLTEAR